MAEESDLEKTEEPTGRRIEQAREKGQVPHSRELGTFLVLIVAGAAFWMMGSWFFQRSLAIARKGFTIESRYMREPDLMLVRLGELSSDALYAFSPLLALLLLAAVLPPFFLNAWVFAPKALVPDLNRLNPLSGLGRMFSWNSLMELGKAVLKATLIGGVAALLIWKERDEIFGLLAEPLEAGLAHAGHLITFSFLMMVAALVIVVAADVPFQLWQYFDKLKMTKEEVKQEMKEMMGDPHVKGRIRSLQMQAARKRMMAAVPEANVVVTNPTHYAVALQYDQSRAAAPFVVAKGTDEIALYIRQVAAENQVEVVEFPRLARSVYYTTQVNQQIPFQLYRAIAHVLTYVLQMKHWREGAQPRPALNRHISIPKEVLKLDGENN